MPTSKELTREKLDNHIDREIDYLEKYARLARTGDQFYTHCRDAYAGVVQELIDRRGKNKQVELGAFT